jgi:hypothetical protein
VRFFGWHSCKHISTIIKLQGIVKQSSRQKLNTLGTQIQLSWFNFLRVLIPSYHLLSLHRSSRSAPTRPQLFFKRPTTWVRTTSDVRAAHALDDIKHVPSTCHRPRRPSLRPSSKARTSSSRLRLRPEAPSVDETSSRGRGVTGSVPGHGPKPNRDHPLPPPPCMGVRAPGLRPDAPSMHAVPSDVPNVPAPCMHQLHACALTCVRPEPLSFNPSSSSSIRLQFIYVK